MELRSFCKYFGADEAIVEGVFERRKIRFTQPWGLNDPLEGTPAISFDREGTDTSYRLGEILLPSEKLLYRGQLVESAVNSFCMLSLTKIPDSFEMWALYASGHHGFLIEFEEEFATHPCMRAADGGEYAIKEVEYVDDYSIDPDSLFQQGQLNRDELIRQVFFRKTRRWKHEEEHRIVRSLSDHPDWRSTEGFQTSYRDAELYLFDLDQSCIASVVFGAHMSRANKRFVYERCGDLGINFFQACLLPELKDEAGHQGKIVIVPLDRFPSHEYVLNSLPQIFSGSAGDPSVRNEPYQISDLSELPYYHRYSREVEGLMAALKEQRAG